MMPLMVMSPPSAKPVLVLSLDFGLIGSEYLQKFGELADSPILCLKIVLLMRQGRYQVHGLHWWKTPTEPNFYLFFSNLRHIEQDKVDVVCFVYLYHG